MGINFFFRTGAARSRAACAALWLVFFLFWGALASAAESQNPFGPGTPINEEVEKAITAVIQCQEPSAALPSEKNLALLLDYMTANDGSSSLATPEKRDRLGFGIFWRTSLNLPYEEAVQYMYNPEINSLLIYPSSIRVGRWKEESDILKLDKPLWEQNLDQGHLILRGGEWEELTPNDDSGSYYSYELDKLIIAGKHRGMPFIMTVNWQSGPSSVGKICGVLGQYSDWDFIYTDQPGATASGIGWMDTYIYASVSISVLFPEHDGNHTAYSTFRWLRAGWSGLNAVERRHIRAGAEQTFSGVKAVLEAPNRPSPAELAEMTAKVRAYSHEELLQASRYYCEQLLQGSKGNELLSQEEFQDVLKEGKYNTTLDLERLQALVLHNMLKQRLGKGGILAVAPK